MALQTLPSSLTADHPVSTSPPPPEQGPDNNDPIDTKNSIPFSFLIAFLALFVAFMAMGLWARRINHFVRRRLGLPIPDPRPKKHIEVKPPKPVVWDVCPGKCADGAMSRWNTMQASFVHG